MESPYFYIIIFVLVSDGKGVWEMGIGMYEELRIVDRLLTHNFYIENGFICPVSHE